MFVLIPSAVGVLHMSHLRDPQQPPSPPTSAFATTTTFAAAVTTREASQWKIFRLDIGLENDWGVFLNQYMSYQLQ